MESLEAALDRTESLSVEELADAIESIGFECTRCGGCCTAIEDESGTEPHTATVFPDEVRQLQSATAEAFDTAYDWRDVARPMPYGLDENGGGETFEWALQTDACGDCTFYEEADDGTGACTVHGDRPLVCRTYPFSLALGGAGDPMGEPVDREGLVRAHECEGLGRDIDREEAEALAETLKQRTIIEIREAIELRDGYEPRPDADGTVVHDSEGSKRPDGTPLDRR